MGKWEEKQEESRTFETPVLGTIENRNHQGSYDGQYFVGTYLS